MEKIRDFVKHILYWSGYYHLVNFSRGLIRPEVKLIILSYHDISEIVTPAEQPDDYIRLRHEINRHQFESHLRVLKKFVDVVSLEEGVEWLKAKRKLKKKLVAITFDDGYESAYNVAFPLLKTYKFPATVFLPTDFINNQESFWWDELEQIVYHANHSLESRSSLIPVIGEELADRFSLLEWNTQGKRELLQEIEQYLRSINEGQRERIIQGLRELLLRNRKVKSENRRCLSWDQIVKMHREGISFGSHTCSHLNLKFASRGQVMEELGKSKEIIEGNLKTRVSCFAYPYVADYETHTRIKPILRNLGYECACACWGGVNLCDSDPFFLKRITFPMTTCTSLIARELLLS